MKLEGWSGVLGKDELWYLYWWNWLKPGHRYVGPYHVWYDGPHRSFGLWFVSISWRMPWTKWDVGYYRNPWFHRWIIDKPKEGQNGTGNTQTSL